MKRGRWSIRWVLSIVIVMLVIGALWTAMNGRREVPGAANPGIDEMPMRGPNGSGGREESLPQVPGT